MEVHLVGQLEVGGVEQKDAQDRWELFAVRCGGALGIVFLEGGDVLGLVVVEDLEVGGGEVMDGVAVAVGDGDVGEDDAGFGAEREGGRLRVGPLS